MDAKHLRLPSPRGADTCQPGSFTLFNPRRRPVWVGLLRRPSLAPTLPPVALLLKMFLVVQDIGFQVFKFCFTFHFFSFLKKYLFIFREGKGRERNIHLWVPLPRPRGPGRQPRHVPRLESNPPPFGWQDNLQSTEPHLSGPHFILHVDDYRVVILVYKIGCVGSVSRTGAWRGICEQNEQCE